MSGSPVVLCPRVWTRVHVWCVRTEEDEVGDGSAGSARIWSRMSSGSPLPVEVSEDSDSVDARFHFFSTNVVQLRVFQEDSSLFKEHKEVVQQFLDRLRVYCEPQVTGRSNACCRRTRRRAWFSSKSTPSGISDNPLSPRASSTRASKSLPRELPAPTPLRRMRCWRVTPDLPPASPPTSFESP